MNLADNLTEITDLAKNGVIQAVAFMKVQMPELIEQIFSYYTTLNIIGIVISFIGIVASIFGIRQSLKMFNENIDSAGAAVLAVVSISAIVIGLAFIIANSITLIQMSIAPKLYLIEYIKGLM